MEEVVDPEVESEVVVEPLPRARVAGTEVVEEEEEAKEEVCIPVSGVAGD